MLIRLTHTLPSSFSQCLEPDDAAWSACQSESKFHCSSGFRCPQTSPYRSSYSGPSTSIAIPMKRRHARCLTRDEVRSPEPDLKRHLRLVHDRASRERCLVSARTANEHARSGRDIVRLAEDATLRTRKAVRPTHQLQVVEACLLVRERPLELQDVGDVGLLFDSGHQPSPSASVGDPISHHCQSCRMEDYLFELYVSTG